MNYKTSTRPKSKSTFPGGTRKFPDGRWNSRNRNRRPGNLRPNGSRWRY